MLTAKGKDAALIILRAAILAGTIDASCGPDYAYGQGQEDAEGRHGRTDAAGREVPSWVPRVVPHGDMPQKRSSSARPTQKGRTKKEKKSEARRARRQRNAQCAAHAR